MSRSSTDGRKLPRWYTVTYRGTAEMVVRLLAETPEDARQRAEDGNYEEAADITWVPNEPYTVKVRVDSIESATTREP